VIPVDDHVRIPVTSFDYGVWLVVSGARVLHAAADDGDVVSTRCRLGAACATDATS